MEHRHTETLLPVICERERYCSIILQYIVKYDIFQVAMSECVDVP